MTFLYVVTGAGLGGSVGCAVRLETGGRGFNPRRGRLDMSLTELTVP